MQTHKVIVSRVEVHGSHIKTIYFTCLDGSILKYDAGQYVTVYFKGTHTPQGKAYSLSSAPHEAVMSITVKKIGEYSGLLHALSVGDIFTISDAYGHFNPHTYKPLVCISAGVGIAPIWSILKEECARDASRVAHLFYSNKLSDAVAFHDELKDTLHRHEGVKVAHHITQQSRVPKHMHKGRIDIEKCVSAVEGEVSFLLCGSVDFVKDMWQGLTRYGVAPEAISSEVFFEQ
ncbi:hypothetical protein EOL96_03300 [Candidatus Saccharibacteria bacterium]|nr:hypothetical protein [Candidatus Saccharibacteria bacterium]